jgi:hypothetical protein
MRRFWPGRKARGVELDRELAGHLALAVEERLAAGVPLSEARIAARREVDRIGLTKHRSTRTRAGSAFKRRWRKIRSAARRLWRLERR